MQRLNKYTENSVINSQIKEVKQLIVEIMDSTMSKAVERNREQSTLFCKDKPLYTHAKHSHVLKLAMC